MTTETLTVPAVTPLEPTTPIKPSEALRLGRLIRPTRKAGSPFTGRHAACAIGAMAIGYGHPNPPYAGIGITADAYEVVADAMGMDMGQDPTINLIWQKFDDEEDAGGDGDAAVLAFLEERGL